MMALGKIADNSAPDPEISTILKLVAGVFKVRGTQRMPPLQLAAARTAAEREACTKMCGFACARQGTMCSRVSRNVATMYESCAGVLAGPSSPVRPVRRAACLH